MIAKSASRLVSLRGNAIKAGAVAAYAVQTPDTPSPEAVQARVAAAFPGVALRVQRVFETTEGELASHFKVVFEGVGFEELDGDTFEVAYDLMDACDLLAAEPLLPFPEAEFAAELDEQISDGSSGSGGCSGTPPADRMWSLEQMAVRYAWEQSAKVGRATKGKGIIIGQVDTGVADHVMVRGQLAAGWNFIDNNDNIVDPLNYSGNPGHGLSVAAAAAGVESASLKMSGVAPLANVRPMRAVTTVVVNGTNSETIALGVEGAWKRGCEVISLSLGGVYLTTHPPQLLKASISTVVNNGMIVIAAAGNHVPGVTYPGWDPNCICVAASMLDRKPWSGSGYGNPVAISAPGHHVWTPWRARPEDPVDKVGAGCGTSYSAAHVAGVAALWLAHHGTDTIYGKYRGAQVSAAFRTLIRRTAYAPAGWDSSKFGADMIHAFSLVKGGLPPVTALASNVESPSPAQRLVEALRNEGLGGESTSRIDDGFALRYGAEIDWLLARRTIARRLATASVERPPHVSESLARALPEVAALAQVPAMASA